MAKLLNIMLASSFALFTAACSSSGSSNNNEPNANTTVTTTNTTANTASSAPGNTETAKSSPAAATAAGEDVPANVRAAFPDAQSITKQHKDLTPSQIAAIEKETSSKVTDNDHHSYLAFSTAGGARRQIGAATVVEASGKEMVVVYESKNGSPFIKEVRAAGVPQAFLDQFKGKGHDDKFQFGQAVKAQGADEATARAATSAIYRDIMTMQTLYGAAHSH